MGTYNASRTNRCAHQHNGMASKPNSFTYPDRFSTDWSILDVLVGVHPMLGIGDLDKRSENAMVLDRQALHGTQPREVIYEHAATDRDMTVWTASNIGMPTDYRVRADLD
jgi:hypothetical protein